MWSSWRRVAFDSAGFPTGGESAHRRTAAVLAATTVVCLLPAPLKIYAFRSDAVDWDIIGSYPEVVYAASDALIGVPGLYGLLLLVGLAVPTASVLVYAAVFHALSRPMATGGSYSDTVAVTAWGLLPPTVAGAVVLGMLYAAVAISGPIQVVTGIHVPGRVVVAPLSRTSPWILLDLLVTASLLGSGYVWAKGLAAVRGISIRRGAAVVALPLGWTLLGTIAGQVVVVEAATFVAGL